MILSLFSGCGGLDLGFEQVGFKTGLAYDIRPFSVSSWNFNRPNNPCAKVADISRIDINKMDSDFGEEFTPTAVIGGPPCQSFTNANSWKKENDPREKMVEKFFSLALMLHKRSELDFILMENVRELSGEKYRHILDSQIRRLRRCGFTVHFEVLDAVNFDVPQFRKRLILVAFNSKKYCYQKWEAPKCQTAPRAISDVISSIEEPVYYSDFLDSADMPVHPNHWCMTPRSRKFFDGSLKPGTQYGRSFKTLSWDKPSFTVSYGNREVHVHPSGKRRLSIYESMKLQGFPDEFVLQGNLSEQITQVSEAVPPPMASSIARGIREQLGYSIDHVDSGDERESRAAAA